MAVPPETKKRARLADNQGRTARQPREEVPTPNGAKRVQCAAGNVRLHKRAKKSAPARLGGPVFQPLLPKGEAQIGLAVVPSYQVTRQNRPPPKQGRAVRLPDLKKIPNVGVTDPLPHPVRALASPHPCSEGTPPL